MPCPPGLGRLSVAARERAPAPAQSAFPPCPVGCPATLDVVRAHISAAPGRANRAPDLRCLAPARLPGLDRPASQTPPSHRVTSVPLGFATSQRAGAVVRREGTGPAGSSGLWFELIFIQYLFLHMRRKSKGEKFHARRGCRGREPSRENPNVGQMRQQDGVRVTRRTRVQKMGRTALHTDTTCCVQNNG